MSAQKSVYKAYFTIAKTWKQSRCPSVNEWINKLVHQIMGYYLALQRNELSVITRHGGTLNAYYRVKSQSEKTSY